LKLWFKQKISKEEFDLEAHRLLTQDNGKVIVWGIN
jgi:transcriptional adapter 1